MAGCLGHCGDVSDIRWMDDVGTGGQRTLHCTGGLGTSTWVRLPGRVTSTWGVLGGMVQLGCLILVAACSAYLRSLGSYWELVTLSSMIKSPFARIDRFNRVALVTAYIDIY